MGIEDASGISMFIYVSMGVIVKYVFKETQVNNHFLVNVLCKVCASDT